MSRIPIDLRSDTVTRPTPAMREAMALAAVGDDVFGDDPTVRELEDRVAALLGKEAALFVPSGTMANQIAVGIHTRPGDELICADSSHVYVWEGGGIARLWGAMSRPMPVPSGLLEVTHLDGLIRPDDAHYTRTRLIWLESTHNRGGGRVHSLESIRRISDWARANSLRLHLDGARLWNAVVASGIEAAGYAALFDTVSVCFSKGLGAPVGSAIAGPAELIRRDAHRLRKVLGGGMRQAGIVAAGALHALEHHITRLAVDHEHAGLLADVIRQTDGLELECDPVETNLVWFRLDSRLGPARSFQERLRDRGVLIAALGPQILRAVTHLDVTREDVLRAAEAIRACAIEC